MGPVGERSHGRIDFIVQFMDVLRHASVICPSPASERQRLYLEIFVYFRMKTLDFFILELPGQIAQHGVSSIDFLLEGRGVPRMKLSRNFTFSPILDFTQGKYGLPVGGNRVRNHIGWFDTEPVAKFLQFRQSLYV